MLFSKGTHHLWSVPVLSFQDITYHFRVSLSVSRPGPEDTRGFQTLSHGFYVLLGPPVVCDWFLSPRAFRSQSEGSCATEGETPSYSDYHFLIQSSCVWDGRRCVPVPLRYTTCFLCGFHFYSFVMGIGFRPILKRYSHKTKTTYHCPHLSTCICIKTSLLAVITGIWNTVFVCHWKCFWSLFLTAVV